MDLIMLEQTELPEEWNEKMSFFVIFLSEKSDWLIGLLPNLIAAVVLLVGGWWLIKLLRHIVKKALQKAKAEPTVISFLDSLIHASSKIVLFVAVIGTLGFDVTTIITAIGAAAVTVGLALKDSLSNVASGTLIILNHKFKTGDFIETEGIIGEVMKIEMMYTTLRTYDYKEVLIPNSRLTSNNVINHFSLDCRRVDVPVPLAYKEDVAKAREVILQIVKNYDRILQDKPNRIIVDKFNDSSVDLWVWVWCKPEDYWPVIFYMREKIKLALEEAGITIPFNQMDIHIDAPAGVALLSKGDANK